MILFLKGRVKFLCLNISNSSEGEKSASLKFHPCQLMALEDSFVSRLMYCDFAAGGIFADLRGRTKKSTNELRTRADNVINADEYQGLTLSQFLSGKMLG